MGDCVTVNGILASSCAGNLLPVGRHCTDDSRATEGPSCRRQPAGNFPEKT
jgi:hypothetical protein